MSNMLNEIREQPSALEKLWKGEKKNIAAIAGRIRKHNPALFEMAARGSSDNAATYGKYLFEYANGLPCSLTAPSIHTVYDRHPNMKSAVVIGISQSGEGTDINESLDSARKTGAYTIGITNTPGSAITRVADDVILLRAGLEKGLAATKTYTCELLALMMLSGNLSGDKKFLDGLARAPEQMNKMLAIEDFISTLSERRGRSQADGDELCRRTAVQHRRFSARPDCDDGRGFPDFRLRAAGKNGRAAASTLPRTPRKTTRNPNRIVAQGDTENRFEGGRRAG